MKRVIVIPDSFKGTIASKQFCQIARDIFARYDPGCEVIEIPVADGGEGSVDCFLAALGGQSITTTAKGPFMADMQGRFGLVHGDTALIEMAAVAGLPLVSGRENPLVTTTYGVGQLVTAALDRGCKEIILALGGSCTNDGGCGAAAALGVIFRNPLGEPFIPTGGTLSEIASIDLSRADPRLKQITLTAICDIDNPLYGPTGAAAVFAPQKGATPEMVELLDQGLRHLADVIDRDLGLQIADLPGSGAAGGMGGGVVALLGARMKMGIETVLDIVNFDDLAQTADLVITGEGRLDSQSLRGKVVIGVARRAQKYHVPVLAVVGDAAGDMAATYDCGVTAVFSTNRRLMSFKEIKPLAAEFLAQTLEDIVRLIKIYDKQ